jgi:hypothetical protein
MLATESIGTYELEELEPAWPEYKDFPGEEGPSESLDLTQTAGASNLASLLLRQFVEIRRAFAETVTVDPNGILALPLRQLPFADAKLAFAAALLGERYLDTLKTLDDHLAWQKRFEEQLRGMFIAEPIEDGLTHPAQALIQKALEENEPLASQWIVSFARKQGPSFAAAAVKAVGRLPTPGSEEWRTSLAEEALEHEDSEVRDAAVQALESWGGQRSIDILKKHQETRPWLKDYIDRVIRDLQSRRTGAWT